MKLNPWMFSGLLIGVVLLLQIEFHWSAIAFSSFVFICLSTRLRSRTVSVKRSS
jgi:hypothetical protein